MKSPLYRPKNRPRRRNGNSIRAGRRLMSAGWTLFAVSMFLPVFPPLGLWGWHCAWIVICGLVQMLFAGGEWSWDWYTAGFALTNTVILLSPVLRGSRKWSPFARRVGLLLTLASALYTLPLLRDGLSGLGVGFYAWFASFWLVFVGTLKLQANLKSVPKTDSATVAAPRPLTEQEMAARRELELFLRS